MGLTVNFDLKAKHVTSGDEARDLVKQMRKLAGELPFREVGVVKRLTAETLDRMSKSKDEDTRWRATAFGESVRSPWGNKDRHCYFRVQPEEVYAFHLWPGEGCESTEIGLAKYPDAVEVTWKPDGDRRFVRTVKNGGCTTWEFDYEKYSNARYRSRSGENLYEHKRTIPTKLGGVWRHGSFCKTQYASDPECGGLPNFLKCHVSLVTLLERIGKLPGVSLSLNDEGHYGKARYSDDWKEADEAGRKPRYVWHRATHSVPELAKQVGHYNELVAAMAGAFGDAAEAAGLVSEAPIRGFANFEQLEFRGCQDENLNGFLGAMKQLAGYDGLQP